MFHSDKFKRFFLGLVVLAGFLPLAALPIPVWAATVLSQQDASPLSGASPETPASFPMTLTLQQSIEQALKTSPRVGYYNYRLLGAEAETGMARSQMLPATALSMGRSYVRDIASSGLVDTDYIDQHTDTLVVQATQPVFAGLTLLNAYQKARINEDLVKLQKASEEALLIRDVQLAFFDLIKAKEDARFLQSAAERLRTSVESARAYERVRMAPYVDVLQAEVDLADTLQRLSKAENQVVTLKIQLNTLLGIPLDTDVDYIGDFNELESALPMTLAQCLDRAMAQRADLLAQRKGVEVAEKDVEIAYGRFLPRVDVQGSYVHRDQYYDTTVGVGVVNRDYKTEYWTAGVNLQWRFFESGRTYYESERARNQVASLREQLREVQDQVASEVHTYFLTLNEAKQRIATAGKALGEATEGHDRAQVQYNAQVGTIVELLDAQARLTRAESNKTQAMADYRQALARLLYAMGERNLSLHF